MIKISIVLFNVLVILSADDTFKAKPEKCKVSVTLLESTIEQLGECSDKKWQPLQQKSLLGRLVPTGLPKIKLFPNGTVIKALISGATNLLPNASDLFSTNLSDPIPPFLKKLIPKSLLNKPKVLTRGRAQNSYRDLKLNERVCCLFYENICVRNKVYRMNCKMSRDFGEEVQQMYDKLVESCAEIGLNIDESFCAQQKTEMYGSNGTCDLYLPCSQKQMFAVLVDNSSQSISSKFIFVWISLVFLINVS